VVVHSGGVPKKEKVVAWLSGDEAVQPVAGCCAGTGCCEPKARTIIFAGLVFGIFLLILINRDLSRSLSHNFNATNPWIRIMFIIIMLLLVAVLNIAFFRQIMGFEQIENLHLLLVLALWAVMSVWLEMVRHVRQFFH
jgi:Ca2+-transporting ATPase